jgi:hypothetical protein
MISRNFWKMEDKFSGYEARPIEALVSVGIFSSFAQALVSFAGRSRRRDRHLSGKSVGNPTSLPAASFRDANAMTVL